MSLFDTSVNEVTRYIHKKQEEKQQQLYCFVKTAMGDRMCLAEPANGPRLSFNTIYLRIADLQRNNPEWAEDCGFPALDDPERQKKIKRLLQEMCAKNILQYHVFGNTWSVVNYVMRSADLEGFCEWREWPRAVIVNAPYKSGIYLFRIAGGKCFSRLKGESDIVYIGATPKGTIRNRLIHHKSSCSDTHYPLARIQEYLGTLEVAWVEYADAQETKMQECVLLTRYGLDHIELPPANRQQSFRMASTVLRYYATASDQERAALIANLPQNREKEAT